MTFGVLMAVDASAQAAPKREMGFGASKVDCRPQHDGAEQAQGSRAAPDRRYGVLVDKRLRAAIAYEVAFTAARLFWALADWSAAADRYMRVVEMNPFGGHAKEAACAAVLALQNALQIDPVRHFRLFTLEGLKSKVNGEPLPVPEKYKKVLAAYDWYLRYLPSAPESSAIRYREALIYFDFDHIDEAVRLLGDVSKRRTGSELAVYSGILLMDILVNQGRPGEVRAWGERFVPGGFNEDGTHNLLPGMLGDAYENEALAFEKRGNFRECGRSMLAAADASREHPGHAQRVWKAGLCFQRAGLVGQALKSQLYFVQVHPNDPLAKEATLRIAFGYHQLQYFSKAADYYEQFADKFPHDLRADWARSTAATFRVGLGQGDQAVADMNSFVGWVSRRPRDPAAVFFHMADLYESNGQREQLTKHLEEYLKVWGAKGGPDRRVLAHFRLGELVWLAACSRPSDDGGCVQPQRDQRDASRARQHFAAALDAWRPGAAQQIKDGDVESRISVAEDAVAGAAFYLAESGHESYLRLEDGTRAARREGIRQAYERVVARHREPWASAAATRIGQLYRDDPASKSRAVDAFAACVSSATANAWHCEWSRRCERDLNRMEPTRYPLPSEITPEVGYTGTNMLPTPVISEVSDPSVAGVGTPK